MYYINLRNHKVRHVTIFGPQRVFIVSQAGFFSGFQLFITRSALTVSVNMFYADALYSPYGMDSGKAFNFILRCPLLICAKFKVRARQQFVKNR